MKHSKEIPVDLTQEQFSFLEEFGERCENSAGSGISETSALRCLLRLFQEVEVDIWGIQTEDELLRRLLNALKSRSHREVVLT